MQTCFYFDELRYCRLQAAFKLLGKTQIAMDHLHMHYTSAIYNSALNIIRLHATTSNEFADDNSEKKPYDKLCLVSLNRRNFWNFNLGNQFFFSR